jgi:LysM repeat protein
MEEVDRFVTRHNGRLINLGGTQCVALSNAFEAEVVKGDGDEFIPTPLTFYAIDWWTNFGRDKDYNEYVRIAAGLPAQKGDLAIWGRYGGYGLPHIALVLADVGNGLLCFTQNPGPAHKEVLTEKGLLGYLRPKKFIKLGMGSGGKVPTYNSGGKYSLARSVSGYTSAADAKAKANSNSNVPAGEYYIFNKANGMVNLTGKKGVPGWWINPSDNKKPSASPVRKVYVVQKGDTLTAIAARYKTTVAWLVNRNKISNKNLIFKGQKLIVRG